MPGRALLPALLSDQPRRPADDDRVSAAITLRPPALTPRAGALLVAAGYVLAFVAGLIASRLHEARLAALPHDTSGGMYAEGVTLSGLGAFLVVALAPTLLALWLLRRHHGAWRVIATCACAFALVGLAAVLRMLVTGGGRFPLPLALLDLIGLAHLLGAPLWALGLALFAWLAPTRPARRLLLAALAIGLLVCACAAAHWWAALAPG